MEKKILDALYSGDLQVGENPPAKDEEYRKYMLEMADRTSMFPEDKRYELEKILELHTQALSCEVKTAFYRGLAVGVRFTQEIYAVDLGVDLETEL